MDCSDGSAAAARLDPDAAPNMNLDPPTLEVNLRPDGRIGEPAARPTQRRFPDNNLGNVPVPLRLVRDHLLPAGPRIPFHMGRAEPAVAGVVFVVELPPLTRPDQLAAANTGNGA